MLRSITAALGAALLLAGCVAGPEVTAGPDPAEIARVTSSAAAQVRRCYRSPRVLSEARQIVTRLRVRFAPDGTLVEVPTVLAQLGLTPVNRPYAGAMAAAAVEAVTRCAPLSLPPELHARGWDEFELTFSPAARA